MGRCLGGDLAFGLANTDGSAGIDDLGDADRQRRGHGIAGPLGFRGQKFGLVQPPQVVECRGVEEGIAPFERGFDARTDENVAADDLDAQTLQRLSLTSGPRQHPDLCAVSDEGADQSSADKAGAAGYQSPH